MKNTARCAMLVASLLPSVAWSNCSTASEHSAIATRVLQTEMMVAALSCHKEKEYNRISTRFSSHFQQQAEIFKGYFERIYQKDAEKNLNRFVTNLANKASAQSLKAPAKEYCQKTEKLFGTLERTDAEKLEKISLPEPFTLAHDIKRCNESASTESASIFGLFRR